MKRLFLLLALLLGIEAVAVTTVVRRDTSSTNIPTSYTTGSQLLSGLPPGIYKEFTCCSTAGTDIAIGTSDVANCAGASDRAFIPAAPASSTVCVTHRLTLSKYFCVKSYGSAISSGIVLCKVGD